MTLSVEEFSSDQVIIYPNPTNQTIKIETENILNAEIINIYNNQGQRVITNKFTDSSILVDIQHLSSGIYFVEIIGKNRKVIARVLIE